MRILVLNGPNLNRLGKRNPAVYGTTSMEQVMLNLQQAFPDVLFTYRQTNHEGCLIDILQDAVAEKEDIQSGDKEGEAVSGIIINPGGLCHTSVSLRDAVEDTVSAGIKVVEVHISDISKRETFRNVSLLSEVCSKSIIGQGTDGYRQAAMWLIERPEKENTAQQE